MSRYSIPAQAPDLTVIVGWDNPLVTFFAQVFDPSIEEDAAACLLWIGTAPDKPGQQIVYLIAEISDCVVSP